MLAFLGKFFPLYSENRITHEFEYVTHEYVTHEFCVNWAFFRTKTATKRLKSTQKLNKGMNNEVYSIKTKISGKKIRRKSENFGFDRGDPV